MSLEAIKEKIFQYKSKGQRLFTTSSFQSHSIVLLHILSRIDPSIPVVFINTGYHFPETIKFRDEITKLLGLNLVDLKPVTPKSMQTEPGGKLLFTTDPDYCCFLNKVQPLETILRSYDVWINGVRRDQSAERKAMKEEQPAPHGVIRYHPLLHWNSKMIFQYLKEHDLPGHPLEDKGYFSVGCEPCTRKIDLNMDAREARWYGLNKNECGLNTDLLSKESL